VSVPGVLAVPGVSVVLAVLLVLAVLAVLGVLAVLASTLPTQRSHGDEGDRSGDPGGSYAAGGRGKDGHGTNGSYLDDCRYRR